MTKTLSCLTALLASLLILTPQRADAQPRFAHSIELGVQLPASLRGHHVSQVKLYGPDGALLTETELPFAAGVGRAQGESAAAILEDGFELTVTLHVPADVMTRYGAEAELLAVVTHEGSNGTEEFRFTLP